MQDLCKYCVEGCKMNELINYWKIYLPPKFLGIPCKTYSVLKNWTLILFVYKFWRYLHYISLEDIFIFRWSKNSALWAWYEHTDKLRSTERSATKSFTSKNKAAFSRLTDSDLPFDLHYLSNEILLQANK